MVVHIPEESEEEHGNLIVDEAAESNDRGVVPVDHGNVQKASLGT